MEEVLVEQVDQTLMDVKVEVVAQVDQTLMVVNMEAVLEHHKGIEE